MFLIPQPRTTCSTTPSLQDWLQDFPKASPLADTNSLRWREDEEGVTVEAVVPGYAEEDLELIAEGSTLTIRTATSKGEEGADGKTKLRPLHRQLRLPRSVELDRAEAHLERGILNIRIPKSEKARARRIEIQGN